MLALRREESVGGCMTANRFIVIGRRFRGPPQSGNGGYVCGLLAGVAGSVLTVRLKRPPPLDQPLEIREDPENSQILLMHGEADDNSGTFPIQSERLYMALKGHGATVRYVTLPFEPHGYIGRESVLHTLTEMINWMDKYVKNAGAKESAAAVSK